MKRKLFLLTLLYSAIIAGCGEVEQPVEEDTVVSAELEEKEETLDTMEIPPEFDYLSYLTLCPFDTKDYKIDNGYTQQSMNLLERFIYLLSLHTNNGSLESEEQFDELYETLMTWSEEALKAPYYDCIALEIQPGKASIVVNIRFVNDHSMSFEIPATFVSEEEVNEAGPNRIGQIDKAWFTDGVMQSVENVPIHEQFDWTAYLELAHINTSFSEHLSQQNNEFFGRFTFLYGVYLDGLNTMELETFQNLQTSFNNWSGETAQFSTYGIDEFEEKLSADTDANTFKWKCLIKIGGEEIDIIITEKGLKFNTKI